MRRLMNRFQRPRSPAVKTAQVSKSKGQRTCVGRIPPNGYIRMYTTEEIGSECVSVQQGDGGGEEPENR